MPAGVITMLAIPVGLAGIAAGAATCIVSDGGPSENTIWLPVSERIALTIINCVGSGGGAVRFHRLPITIGLLTSPCSKATSTSSPGCGTKYVPHIGPADSVA